MKLDLTGIQIDITPAIQDFVTKKIKKLDKFFEEDTIIHVTFSAKKEKQRVEVRVEYKGKTYIAEEDTDDLYTEIDRAIDKIQRQVRKQKTRFLRNRSENDMSEPIEVLDADVVE